MYGTFNRVYRVEGQGIKLQIKIGVHLMLNCRNSLLCFGLASYLYHLQFTIESMKKVECVRLLNPTCRASLYPALFR